MNTDEIVDGLSRKDDVVSLKCALKCVLEGLERRNVQIYRDIASELEVMCLDNGLTRQECVGICSGMVDQDGKKGGRWTDESVKAWLRKNGLPEREEGRYNLNALVCAMNMMWSDHTLLVKGVAAADGWEDESICHALAVDVLKDDDGVFDIRRYFGLKK